MAQSAYELSDYKEDCLTSPVGALSAQELNQAEHYAKLFNPNAAHQPLPPHLHDKKIYLYALQLKNFFERAWHAGALNGYQADRATLIAQAQAKDARAGAVPPQGGNPQFATNWQELVEKRLIYTETQEITHSRKKALELLLPISDWIALLPNIPNHPATNGGFVPGYDGLLETIDCDGTRSAVYNSFFDHVAKALATNLNISYT